MDLRLYNLILINDLITLNDHKMFASKRSNTHRVQLTLQFSF